MKVHYVYIHRRKTDGAPFYVGKGKGRRAWQKYGRNRYWNHVEQKHGFEVQIVKDNLPEPCALSLERIIVSTIKEPLANMTEGGGGTTGWKHSEETKARIGAHWKGRKLNERQMEALRQSNAKRVMTDEWRKRLSEASKRRKRTAQSPETRAKIAASHIGLRPSAETLKKMSLAKKGKNCGRESPSYDHTVRNWKNDDGREFSGTRADFINKFQLANGCVSAVINKRQKSVKGWRLI